MSDLPAQGRYQQMHARAVPGEELEVLGKSAAAKWRCGEYPDLTEAVVGTVKHASLSPEQVKRVIEFANTDAFLHEFKKEGELGHKVVEFEGGPADPADVLRDLNDGGGGTVFDRGTLDYGHAPAEVKVSSAHDEALAGLFGSDAGLPYAEPLAEVVDLRDKLASAYDHLTSELSGLEVAFSDLTEGLYQHVKQAALAGHSLGNIANVMATGSPDPEYMKVAFRMITPRLINEGVFHSMGSAVASMDKTASGAVPNEAHPLVTQTREFCDCLLKLAEVRAAREDVSDTYHRATSFLKVAGASENKGAVIKAVRAIQAKAKDLGESAGARAGAAKRWAFGGEGKKTEKVVSKLIEHAPNVALIGGAAAVGRRIANNPIVRQARYGVKSEFEPWTPEYKYETARQRGEV